MEKEEIIAKATELLAGKFIVKGIHNVNHALGHGYTLGPKHIVWGSKNNGGVLSGGSIERMEKENGPSCAQPGCMRYYHEHTSDKVLFLQLTQNLENKEASDLLFKVKEEILLPEKIDGIAFVDTSEKYRILPEKESEL